jgi:DNA-binding MarR family transcriptional regulator
MSIFPRDKHAVPVASFSPWPPSTKATIGPGVRTLTMAVGTRIEDLAHELFDVVTQICLSTLRGRRRSGDLKEVEFLSLSLLQANGTMIVGDIQRVLGILPAQMSRIIRSLENRDHPLIECRINPRDKRKIDVCLTSTGERSLAEYQGVRVGRLIAKLQSMSDDDQEELLRVLNKLHGLLDKGA